MTKISPPRPTGGCHLCFNPRNESSFGKKLPFFSKTGPVIRKQCNRLRFRTHVHVDILFIVSHPPQKMGRGDMGGVADFLEKSPPCGGG